MGDAIRTREGLLAVGRTTWVAADTLMLIAGAASRARVWRTGRVPSAVKVGCYTFRKLWTDRETVSAVLERLLLHGLSPNVSSWGGVWRRFAPQITAPKGSIAQVLARGTWPYAWIELRRGAIKLDVGWPEWDLSGAYPWASSLGLPASYALELSKDHSPRDNSVTLCDGVAESRDVEDWVLPTWLRQRVIAPKRIRRSLFEPVDRTRRKSRWVPGQFMRAYNLRPVKPLVTVEWGASIDLRPAFDSVRLALPERIHHKSVLASHWGSWIARRGCLDETWVDGKIIRSRMLPMLDNRLNAGVIQSRVHGRISRVAEHASRIYIDSAVLPPEVTPHPIGSNPGDWRHKGDVIEIQRLPLRPISC